MTGLEEDPSEVVNAILSSLKGHVETKNAEGVRVDSHLFNSTMDEYRESLSEGKRREFRTEYLKTMDSAHNLINNYPNQIQK